METQSVDDAPSYEDNDQPDINTNTNTAASVSATSSELELPDDDDNNDNLPLPMGMAEVISNTIEPKEQKSMANSKPEQHDNDDGPEPPIAMLEESLNATEKSASVEHLASSSVNDELSPPIPFDSTHYEDEDQDAIAKKVAREDMNRKLPAAVPTILDEEDSNNVPTADIESGNGRQQVPPPNNVIRRPPPPSMMHASQTNDNDITSVSSPEINESTRSLPILEATLVPDTPVYDATFVQDVEIPWYKRYQRWIVLVVVLVIGGLIATIVAILQPIDTGSDNSSSIFSDTEGDGIDISSDMTMENTTASILWPEIEEITGGVLLSFDMACFPGEELRFVGMQEDIDALEEATIQSSAEAARAAGVININATVVGIELGTSCTADGKSSDNWELSITGNYRPPLRPDGAPEPKRPDLGAITKDSIKSDPESFINDLQARLGPESKFVTVEGFNIKGVGESSSVNTIATMDFGSNTTLECYQNSSQVAPLENTLETTFEDDTGSHGALFDILATENVTLTGIDLNMDWESGDANDVLVYARQGSWLDHQNSRDSWPYLLVNTTLSRPEGFHNRSTDGPFIPTKSKRISAIIPESVFTPLEMKSGETWAIYICSSLADLRYLMGSSIGNTFASNTELSIMEGAGASDYPPFGSGDPEKGGIEYTFYAPRVFSGQLRYDHCPSRPRTPGIINTTSPTLNNSAPDIINTNPQTSTILTTSVYYTFYVEHTPDMLNGEIAYDMSLGVRAVLDQLMNSDDEKMQDELLHDYAVNDDLVIENVIVDVISPSDIGYLCVLTEGTTCTPISVTAEATHLDTVTSDEVRFAFLRQPELIPSLLNVEGYTFYEGEVGVGW